MPESLAPEIVEEETEVFEHPLSGEDEQPINGDAEPEIKDDESDLNFLEGLQQLQQHYGSSEFEAGENLTFRILERTDGTFLMDYGNGYEPVTGDDNTRELLQGGPVVKVEVQGNGGTVLQYQGSRYTEAGIVHSIASQGYRYIGEHPQITDELSHEHQEEAPEVFSTAPSPEPAKEHVVSENTAWIDKLFGQHATREQSINFSPVPKGTLGVQQSGPHKIFEFFPPSVTTMSPQETKVMPTENIFHEVAAASVGTQVVIPGESVLDEFEGANQVIRDAIVVKRLDTGVSISFVESVINNPFFSLPADRQASLVQPTPRLWPTSQPLSSVDTKAVADESLQPAGIEASSPAQIETVRAATPNQVEENGHTINPTWQPGTQQGIESKQPLPAVDGLPIVTYRVDTMFSNSTKLAIDQNVSHNPSSPPLIRGGNLTLPSTPNSSSPSLWSEPQSPAERMPINVLENVTDRAPEDVPVQPTAAKQTPGVGFVRIVETRSAQFIDMSSLKTSDPALPKSIADSPVVFDQAPLHLKDTDYLVNSHAIVNDIRESTTVRVQEEASTGVQHEPTFPLAREDSHDTPVFVKETIVSDRRESVEAAHESVLAPDTGSSQERVGAEPSVITKSLPSNPSSLPLSGEGRLPLPLDKGDVRGLLRGDIQKENTFQAVSKERSRPEKPEKVVIASVEIKLNKRQAAPSLRSEPAYLFAPLIISTPIKPRHVIRIEATNIDEAQQQSPQASRNTRPELISEIRRRVGSPGARSNRAAQIVAPPPARAITQASA